MEMGRTLTPPAAAHNTLRAAAWVAPVILTNIMAFYGQVQWAHSHLAGPLAIAWAYALTIEAIGIYLAAEAHSAMLAGVASLRLRLSSYGVGFLAGALNYSHWAGPGFTPTAQAVTFAAMSAISPMLWSVRSRNQHRAELVAAGLIDPRTVRFSAARWLLYPRKSWGVMRQAVWAGESDPLAAIARFDGAQTTQPDPEPQQAEKVLATPTPRAVPAKKLPAASVPQEEAVQQVVQEHRKTGTPITKASVHARFKKSSSWCSDVARLARERVEAEKVVTLHQTS